MEPERRTRVGKLIGQLSKSMRYRNNDKTMLQIALVYAGAEFTKQLLRQRRKVLRKPRATFLEDTPEPEPESEEPFSSMQMRLPPIERQLVDEPSSTTFIDRPEPNLREESEDKSLKLSAKGERGEKGEKGEKKLRLQLFRLRERREQMSKRREERACEECQEVKSKTTYMGARLQRGDSFSLRKGPETKFFIFNSKDEYIRRVLLGWGWQENKVLSSQQFNLKWSFTEGKDSFELGQGQFFNQFRRNHELTTKNALRRNLASFVSPYGLSAFDYHPLSFELSFASDLIDFQYECERLHCSVLLRRAFRLTASKREAQVEHTQQLLLGQGFVKNYQGSEGWPGLIGLISYSKKLREFARAEDPFHKELANKSPLLQVEKQLLLQFERWEQLPCGLLQVLVKEHNKMSKMVGPAWLCEGDEQLWIVKPCGYARGKGIKVVQGKTEAMHEGRSITRVLQKYIEKPLLLQGFSPQFDGRKFDIRQWVLVTSLRPLRVFMFSDCYLRFGGGGYDLAKFRDNRLHLTNYSLNKGAAHSYMLLADFKPWLQAHRSVDWDADVLPFLQLLVLNTVESAHTLMEHNPRCFQLFGFDILLDEAMHPWLLEVNQSPACEERGDDLARMLAAMGEQLLRIVLNGESAEKVADQRYSWVPLHEEGQRNLGVVGANLWQPKAKGSSRSETHQ